MGSFFSHFGRKMLQNANFAGPASQLRLGSALSRIAFVLIFVAVTTTLGAVEILDPQLGSLGVTITGIEIGLKMKSSAAKEEATGLLIFLHQSVANETSGVQWGVARPSASETVITLNSAIAAQDTILVVDSFSGESAGWFASGAQSSATFDLVGFEAGATTVSIIGLEDGASLKSIYTTPGHGPSTTTLSDGGWADQDNEINGTIVCGPMRFFGPDHFLAGDLWSLAIEGSGSGADTWVATGDLVRYTVPVVSHVIGASGQPFISDLVISNTVGLEMHGWIRFAEDGVDWASAPEVSFSLDPGATTSWSDVLQNAFGIQSNVKGALQVGGFPMWTAAVSSRNYTVDDEDRQFGIALAGIATSQAMTSVEPWILTGLRQDAQFRSNLFVAGAVPQVSTVTIRIIKDGVEVATTTREVPGYGLLQINRLAPSLGIPEITDAYVEINVESGAVVAGLSVIDGSADDAAYIEARPLFQ